MVLANAMRTAQVRLNQHGISYNDLRYVQKNLNVQSFGKEFIETRLSTSGAKYWSNQGQLTFSGECANNNADTSKASRDESPRQTICFWMM